MALALAVLLNAMARPWRRAQLLLWKFQGMGVALWAKTRQWWWDRGRFYLVRRTLFFDREEGRGQRWLRFLLWRWRHAEALRAIVARSPH